jgi:MFS family permease
MRSKVYIFAFILSFSVTVMFRGLFFLTSYRLGMSDGQNLLLALVSGMAYVVGAQLSHHSSRRFSSKASTLFLVGIQMLSSLLCYFHHSFLALCILFSLFALANGMTWPFAESYASAGLDRKKASSSIGIYNICWSGAVPLAVWASGWIISASGPGIFIFVSAGVLLASLPAFLFPRDIPHSDRSPSEQDDPGERIPGAIRLLFSSRWSMFFSYCLIQLLSSLLPGRLKELGTSVDSASFIAGFVDVSRILVFTFMSRTHCWHGSKALLASCSPALAAGFAICMLAGSLKMIIVGEIVLGAFAAAAYYAALFYAMFIGNAKVGADGSHESVIGAGFVAGPVAGLAAEKLAMSSAAASSVGSPMLSLAVLGTASIAASTLCLLKKDDEQ